MKSRHDVLRPVRREIVQDAIQICVVTLGLSALLVKVQHLLRHVRFMEEFVEGADRIRRATEAETRHWDLRVRSQQDCPIQPRTL